jgi:hypothetical protein
VRPLWALPLLLAAASALAAEGRRVEMPAAPPSAPLSAPLTGLAAPSPAAAPGAAAVPSVPAAARLAAPLSPAAAAPPLAAAAAAPQGPAAVAGGPAALPAAARGLPEAARAQAAASSGKDRSAAESGASPEAGAEADAAEARALFDRAAAGQGPAAASIPDIVAKTGARRLSAGVFIQQEQEGSLLASDPRDSSGNVFRYYRPVELREDLADQVHDDLSAFAKASVALKRAFRLHDRKSEYAAWDAWPLRAKLSYLDKLEKAVVAEKGRDAAWKGKVSLLLERKPGAPDFLTLNPHMEAPPPAYKDSVGAAFLQPEVVSDKEHPASTVNEAIGRTKVIIGDTGHAGTQYHVFVKASPETLRAQLPRLQAALQLLNDALFARAAQESFQNVTHPSLMPWHRGRSERVAQLITKGDAAAHTPAADDADSEKHAFIGLRYWGMEGGKMVVSFELRGGGIPFKAKQQAARDMGSAELPKRDYTEVQRWLTLLSLYAEQLAQGRAPALPRRDTALDLAAAERVLSARAAQLGIPEGAYFGLAEFSKRLTGRDEVPPGLIFPFSASAPGSPYLRALTDAMLKESARLRAAEAARGEGADRAMNYLIWSAYREWAADYEARQRGMLDALWRAVAPG